MADEVLAAICVQPILPLFNCPRKGHRWEMISAPGALALALIVCAIFLVTGFRLSNVGDSTGGNANSTTLDSFGCLPNLCPIPSSTSSSNHTDLKFIRAPIVEQYVTDTSTSWKKHVPTLPTRSKLHEQFKQQLTADIMGSSSSKPAGDSHTWKASSPVGVSQDVVDSLHTNRESDVSRAQKLELAVQARVSEELKKLSAEENAALKSTLEKVSEITGNEGAQVALVEVVAVRRHEELARAAREGAREEALLVVVRPAVLGQDDGVAVARVALRERGVDEVGHVDVHGFTSTSVYGGPARYGSSLPSVGKGTVKA
ncbi:hypothetical protein CHU98_g3078 [Xylaria longipes]|nr:hypothetical protein CHU98_g3078 [Xylaria longipes]